MKSSLLDYLLCTVVVTFILGASVGLVYMQYSFSKALLQDFHVIFDSLLLLLAFGLITGVVVRCIVRIWPIAPGEYDSDSPVFVRWKLVSVLYRLGQGALLPFTSVVTKPLVETLFGAKLGADVALGGAIDDPYQVTVGKEAILGFNSLVSGNMLYGGKLVCGKVKIGAGALIGVNCVVLPGVEIGEKAVLMGGAHVMPNTKIPAGETWRGNPARKWQ
ncbi:MAG TPA: DapH/DapD/GlmU-related protein [Zoogloea sp.]|nr:DapH/DapD/GlmU-related protein [Zoogloea sp.]